MMQFDPEESASVTILAPTGSGTSATARIMSISGRRMSIACDIPAHRGTTLRIQWSQFCVLGEVLSVHDADGVLMLRINHALKTSEIEHMRQKWI
jgi:hypothetical protein